MKLEENGYGPLIYKIDNNMINYVANFHYKMYAFKLKLTNICRSDSPSLAQLA
jgi:hypothetical protein